MDERENQTQLFCGTCKAYVRFSKAKGRCHLNPPDGPGMYPKVDPKTDWCIAYFDEDGPRFT